MFEVFQVGNRFTWHFITDAGRVIFHAHETYPCDFSASKDAFIQRSKFFSRAEEIDERSVAMI